MLVTLRTITLLGFGLFLIVRPLLGLMLGAHLHPPGWGYSVVVAEHLEADEFVFRSDTMVELGKLNSEFKEDYDQDYARSERQIQSILDHIHRSDWLLVGAGTLLLIAALPIRRGDKIAGPSWR